MIKLSNVQIEALTNKVFRDLEEGEEKNANLQNTLDGIWKAWNNSADKKIFDKYNTQPLSINIIKHYAPELNISLNTAYRSGNAQKDSKLLRFGESCYSVISKYNNNTKQIIREDIILYSIDTENIDDLIIKLTNKFK